MYETCSSIGHRGLWHPHVLPRCSETDLQVEAPLDAPNRVESLRRAGGRVGDGAGRTDETEAIAPSRSLRASGWERRALRSRSHSVERWEKSFL